jgi:hypothetical protein
VVLAAALLAAAPLRAAAATLYLYDSNNNLVATLDDQSVSWCTNATTATSAASATTCQSATTAQTASFAQTAATATTVADGAVSLGKLASEVRTVPPGTVIAFAGQVVATTADVNGTEPTGYLLCAGQELSRTKYPRLFAAIGTTYGVGNNSTTFKLPDYQGVFLRGLDKSGTFDPGRTLGVRQEQAFQNHGHTVYTGRNDSGYYHGNGAVDGHIGNPGSYQYTGKVLEAAGLPGTALRTGTETRPVNYAVNYLIAF